MRFTRYFKVVSGATKHKMTHLKFEVYYSLGGYNYFTYKPEKRGYYISLTPVERMERNNVVMEAVSMFSGYKFLLKEVTRQSKSAFEKAKTEGLGMFVDFKAKTFPDIIIDDIPEIEREER